MTEKGISMSVCPNHKTVNVCHPYYPVPIPIDKKLASLIRLMWNCGIETFSSCQEDRPGLAMIGFLNTVDIETFFFVARRAYFLDAAAFYTEDEEGNCVNCQCFLSIYFPTADIPRLVKAFTISERERQAVKAATEKDAEAIEGDDTRST